MAESTSAENRIEQGYFSFLTVEGAEAAVTEAEKIKRLEKQLDYGKPGMVLALYKKAVEGRVFSTPEGFAYLLKLREYLKKNAPEENVPGIPVEVFTGEDKERAEKARAEEKIAALKEANHVLRTGRVTQRIIIVFLGIGIIIMMVIATLSDSPNILNYERVLQDRYSSWEQELKDREESVRERELELKRQEK
ncbi:MAG: hypothetical protein IKI75_07255 [Lachnospiraceae bacterium]|nr:hypothetical protein [Lachnospiraceae bacterium]